MQVTNVVVTKTEKENSRMKGIASITINDCFAVHDIRIIEGDKSLFIAMPSRRTANGYRDLAHPINQETRDLIQSAILEEYNKMSESNEEV